MKIVNFIKVARNRFNSNQDYVKFQQFQAEWVLDKLKLKDKLKGMEVLDLGCGYGGYTNELAKHAKVVYALDLHIPKNLKKENVILIQGDALNIPLKGNSLDFVFCSSLIEHVPDQNKLASEIKRVLKPDGICYLSTIPWYCPLAGHQFKPFHLLGEKLAIRFSKIFYGIEAENFETSFGDWGLYPITIRRIKKLARKNNLRVLDIKTRWLPVNIAKIPFLNEIFVGHVEFFLQSNVVK